jgi:tripeptidyl-peptidase-1
MFVITTLLSAAVGIQAVFASPIRARTPYSVKETHFVPHKWIRRGRAPGSHMIQMQIGLKQSQFDELERHLYEGITKPFRNRANRVWEGIEMKLTNMGSL